LGAIIERVTGKNFDTVMNERILAPLDMTSTGFAIPMSQASRLTTLYGRTGDETYVIDAGATSDFTRPSTLLAGGGGLVSTARDMTHFAEMLLENGQFRGRRIAKSDTIDQAIRLYSTRPTAAAVTRPILSAVGASSTMLHVDRAQGMYAIFLAQLNLSGPPAVATRYRPELLSAIAADTVPRSS
jgi:CubicO group peptidase (beta-lactamase class C family)